MTEHSVLSKTENCSGRVAGEAVFALREVVTIPKHSRLGQRRKTVPAGSQAGLCPHCEKSLHNRNTAS